MVMKKPPVMISPSGRVPGRASEPSREGFRVDGGVGTFHGIWLGCLGFSRDGEYMGEEAESTEAGGPTRTLGAGPGLAAPRPRVATLWPLFDSPSDSVFVS